MTWDKRYERKAIMLLAVGFGLVGLDRFIIMPLFPVIAEDLGLTYQDLGLISGSLAFTWGLAAIFGGGLADRIG
ncbi:MAG: MFS transporter, partial [Pseudomonadota bacterium]